ncbi:MAG TPA: hypothetical protein VMG12_14600 [Polyangiaceae bacterium]|nr:hypothetical protein [Polyangiaceae bacterium]
MKLSRGFGWLGMGAALVACSSDEDDAVGAVVAEGPLYALQTSVSTDTDSTTYVALFDALDAGQLDLSGAREFAGYADLAVVDGKVFVSSGEAPEVSRFALGAEGRLQDDGIVSFANYIDDANFYNQKVVSAAKVYLMGDGEIVIWNPSTLEITGTLALPELPVRENIRPYIALDRGAVLRDNLLFATAAWSDTEELNMLGDSRIVVIDVEQDAVVDVLEAPCPDLGVADRDEAGNLYFSNWVYSPGATLLSGASPACLVRIAAGSTTLDNWSLGYAQVNGREGAAISYVGGGKWLYSSFLGDPAEFDAQSDDWFPWLFGDTWQLEVLDPALGTSSIVSSLPKNGGGYYSARLDGVTHVLIPGDEYASTSVHALGADGAVAHELDVVGWSTRLFRVR